MTRKGQREVMLAGLDVPTKIRKRGCSSSSSRIHNYRFNKRAILVGKNRARPIWRSTPLRIAIESPKCLQPVSARRLAATLWEMNEMPLPEVHKKNVSRQVVKAERLMHSGSGSGYLPPHSPTASEKMDRSGTGSRRRRTPSFSQKLLSEDSLSDASFMEVESVVGGRSRLKDASSALTTSKELLKIIWTHADRPSSTASLISALHAELERARLQVNQLIQEQRSDKNEVNYLIKCFAEEKASWKNRQQLAVEAAIGRELEVERRLRRQLERLNARLGKEVSEIKSSLAMAVKELESEKRARELTEEVCDKLARNIKEDRAEVEKLKRESVRVRAEVEKEREMLQLVDKLHEERAQMKLSEAKHEFEEKNSAISKLRKQLEVFLGTKRDKDVERATYSSKHSIGIGPHQHEGEDDEEVKDGEGYDSAESDLHCIELDLNKSNNADNNEDKWGYSSAVDVEVTNERNSITSLQRSASDGFHVAEKEAQRSSYLDEMQRMKSDKGRANHGPPEQSWPAMDPCPERSHSSKPKNLNGEVWSQNENRALTQEL